VRSVSISIPDPKSLHAVLRGESAASPRGTNEKWNMAQVTKVRLVDDLDGSDADESVSFTLDGKALEIDLSAANAERLREILAPYIAAARHGDRQPVRRQQPVSAASAAPHEPTGPIREWAAANGFEVSARGRISSQIMDAYQNRDADKNGDARDAEVKKPARPVITDPFKVSFVS
jgi:hypothetical protein